jgi:hypothetical protein
MRSIKKKLRFTGAWGNLKKRWKKKRKELSTC